MDSRVGPRHLREKDSRLRGAHYSLTSSYSSFCPARSLISRSSGLHNIFWLSYVKVKCIFVSLFGDQVFQVTNSTFWKQYSWAPDLPFLRVPPHPELPTPEGGDNWSVMISYCRTTYSQGEKGQGSNQESCHGLKAKDVLTSE